ncbi:hypothetical protein ROZALSC1DRAFT_27261 [Rozella allomycis CSF55]|uniref:G-protein coupled receptors family 3 profile domain-containing protein n=1 Tax=Rozella allomycis (strain CSF55) TaxID=988480 RepID=A0A075AWE4_ROZAC|nr:hypothetical protein O9G_001907 [Rozella allomycis CSF55]RKP21332.1 hypothetical protein ROZALSC1DRAFT_27261 [Rozella allomycis CSF55]|eukprot:EPZ34605.1 hypothetical protein O9G_001907 [Rozella allomycis CSF55]
MVLVLIMVTPVYLLSGEDLDAMKQKYVVLSLGFWFMNTFTMISLFVPKLLEIIKREKLQNMDTGNPMASLKSPLHPKVGYANFPSEGGLRSRKTTKVPFSKSSAPQIVIGDSSEEDE